METNSNFYNRISNFGEYQYNFQKNTIFVFQLTFIFILVLILLHYFNRVGFISTPNLWLLSLIFSIVLVLIYINRFVVMPKLINKNEFDKLNFGDNTLTPTIPVEFSGTIGGNTGPPTATENCVSAPAPVPAPVCTQNHSIY
jgi:hypothetical protein